MRSPAREAVRSTSSSSSTSATRTSRVAYRRPPVYRKQREFLGCTARYVVVEASTKTGKTVAMLIWLLEQAMRGKPGWNFWWVAPVYPQAKIAYRRLRRWLRRQSVAAGFDLATSNETELSLTLANGAVIWFKSGEKPDNLYGEDVHAAVLDEATRMREESWHAIRSTLTATGGPVRIIGNVKGRKNWAFHLARKAEAGEPGMAHFRLTAYDAADGLAELKAQEKIPANAKVITRADIEDARRQLPEAVFAELFLAIPSDDGSNPFGLAHIAACVAERASGPASAAGWDLAKAQDWTVGIGLNGKGQWCWCERWQGPWEVTIGRIKAVNGEVPALVDSTGVGDPIVERLRREAGGQYLPYPFTGPSKQRLMEGLAVAIQQHEITIPDGVVRQELEAFEFEYTRTGVRYSAPDNTHDDCVMALALGVQLWSRYGGDMSETDWAMGVWRCECGHGFIWQPGRACPDCGRTAPNEYPNPAEVEAA